MRRRRRLSWFAGAGAALAALAVAAGRGGRGTGVGGGSAHAAGGVTYDARLLLVAADGTEPALAAMQAELDQIGTPYTVMKTATGAVSATALADSTSHGLFNGIVLVGCGAGAGPDAGSLSTIDAYAAGFGVRTACLYARPDSSLGLDMGTTVDTRTSPVTLQYTSAGQQVFGWYATTAPVVVSGVGAALASASDATTTPLLTDQAGHAAVAVHHFSDGRELLLLTFDQAVGAAHSSQLLCGVANWLSRGVFIGEKRAYFTPQADDLFLGTPMWDGTVFRISAAELQAATQWQAQVRAMPVGADFRITFPFNGSEVNDSDPLTQMGQQVGPQLFFVSHTFDHHRLDAATADQVTQELTKNDAVMQKYSFGPYDRDSLITPDISGLANGPVMQAIFDWGVKQIVCDTSAANCRPPLPNTGLQNAVAPSLFMIPRIPTNLYANVSTPTEWVAEYNAVNGKTLGHDLSIQELVDQESSRLLSHLLASDLDPVMFHQANLHAYDGTHALMTDLIDQLISKYAALRVLPLVSLQMSDIAARMQDRAALPSAGVTATITPGQSITIQAAQSVRVPITGASSNGAETYGSVTISRVQVPAGGQVTLSLVPATPDGGSGDGGVAGATASRAEAGATGNTGCSCQTGRRPNRPGAAPVFLAAIAMAIARRRARVAHDRL